MSRVVVCGSLNMDVVVQSGRFPKPGETLAGAEVKLMPGGKGLNQAIAAARLGVPVAMVGAVGNDAFSNALRGFLAANDVDSLGVREIDGPSTGIAIIHVVDGENAITVASGANMQFVVEMLREEPRRDEVWVAQFETPLAATTEILTRARAAGARTVLNMAPFEPAPSSLLEAVDVAVLNETELSQATGVEISERSTEQAIAEACKSLREKGPRAVVATLGARGALVATADDSRLIPSPPASLVDSTGAGDCFVGALAARMSLGATPLDAATYAVAAASCSVERLGAAPSMPKADEVAARLAKA